MAFNPLAFLRPAVRAAYTSIKAGAAGGISARAMTRTLRGEGFDVRLNEVEALYRSFQGAERAGRGFATRRSDQHFNPLSVPLSETRLRRTFSITYRVEGFDAVSGEPTHRFVTVSTDNVLTRGEADDLAMEGVAGGDSLSGFDATHAVPVSMVRAGGKGLF